MWKYKISLSILKPYKLLFFVFLVTNTNFNDLKAAYLTSSDINKIKYSCYIESEVPVFCSFGNIERPDIIVFLPVFKPVKLDDRVRAYRVMATITNKMPRTITGAKIRLKFKDTDLAYLDFMITEQIKYNMSSTTTKSHLIREDVPSIRYLYEKINDTYYTADISNLDFEIRELRFAHNQ